MKMHLVCIGKIKGPYKDMFEEYRKRLSGGLNVHELSAATRKEEAAELLQALPPKSFVILLDETGRDLSSMEFAALLERKQGEAIQNLAFIIGGADGVTEDVFNRADFRLSLGVKTWPHMLARVMLIEQIYRAQQINSGHPYHRA